MLTSFKKIQNGGFWRNRKSDFGVDCVEMFVELDRTCSSGRRGSTGRGAGSVMAISRSLLLLLSEGWWAGEADIHSEVLGGRGRFLGVLNGSRGSPL